MNKKKKPGIGRREFVKTSVAATGGMLIVKPETAFGSSANSMVNIGLLGCGGRGTSVAGDFVQNTNSQVTALGDLFQDRLDVTSDHFGQMQSAKGRSEIKETFRGPEAYRELAASDVDMILVSSPPYFHPLHAEASIEAGKHTYLEKPVATDVRGCKKVASLASRAEGRVSVDVGFQIRSGPLFAELTRRIHRGDIGDIACAHGFYFAGDLPRRTRPDMSRSEHKIRNWYFDRVLAGDILVEQNIHIIDVFNWVLKAHPFRAESTAGRKVRTNIGDVSDHFAVTYHYPNDIRASFMSTQFLPEWGDVCMRFFGPKGFSEAFYSGGLRIKGENPWEAGADAADPGKALEVDPLGDATPEKAKAFIESIHSGHFHNQLKLGAESSLSAILGRESAYEGKGMSWGDLLDSDQHWETDIDIREFA